MSINAKNLPDAVNNQSLFSDYYLDSLIVEQSQWANTPDIESDYAAIKNLFDAVAPNNEAQDFTPWLEQNIGVLNETIGLDLSDVRREHPAGDFNVDLVAQDEEGNPVIIENQLERSDHNHIGKLITYLIEIDAKTAIWIVADPRPEHIRAVSRLNESCLASFYLIKLEAVTIGGSLPAPLLTLVVGSNEVSQEASETRQELTERDRLRFRFWQECLPRSNERSSLFNTVAPGKERAKRVTAGILGLKYGYVIQEHSSEIELYIDRSDSDDRREQNQEIFDTLQQAQEPIEVAFREPLDWRHENMIACRVRKQFELGGYRDEDRWEEIQDAMIDAMIRLEQAFRPHIDALQV